jgi:hypothetical protein
VGGRRGEVRDLVASARLDAHLPFAGADGAQSGADEIEVVHHARCHADRRVDANRPGEREHQPEREGVVGGDEQCGGDRADARQREADGQQQASGKLPRERSHPLAPVREQMREHQHRRPSGREHGRRAEAIRAPVDRRHQKSSADRGEGEQQGAARHGHG